MPPLLVTLITLLFHGLWIWLFPNASSFGKYTLAAQQYLSGELPTERLMDFSPLYLQLAIFLERAAPNPEKALLILQLLAVAVAAGMFYDVLCRRLSARLSLLAVAALALDRHLLVYEQILEPEAFVLFFLLAVLFFLDRGHPLAAGLSAALSLATRPNLLPVFLLVPLALYFRGLRKRELGRATVAFLLPLVTVFILLMIRAERITGDPTTPTMNPGTVFFEGNNPLSYGTSAVYPPVVLAYVQRGFEIPDSAHQHYRMVARAESGEDLSIAEVNAFWAGKALHFIRQEPVRFAELLLKKLVRCFHSFRWHDVPTAWAYDRDWLLPTVPFALISALALIGLLFEAPRWRQSLLFYALVVAQIGVMLVFYVSARQRLPLLPALLYFAAMAIAKLRQERRKRTLALLLAALMGLALMLPNDLTRDEHYRRRGVVETEFILKPFRESNNPPPMAQNTDRVLDALAASAWWLDWTRPAGFPQDETPLDVQLVDHLEARDVRSSQERFDLAVLQTRVGREEAARSTLQGLRREGTIFYRKAFAPSDPRFFLARLAARRGERAKAIEWLEEALQRTPGDPFVLADLIALTDEADYQRELLANFSAVDGQFLLAQALIHYERWPEAETSCRFLISRLPDFREAYLMLTVALGASGRLDEAARAYREAIRFDVEPVLFSEAIVEIFRRWATAAPDQPEIQLFTAQVLHQHGRLKEAVARLEALGAPPAALHDAVELELRRLRAALGR